MARTVLKKPVMTMQGLNSRIIKDKIYSTKVMIPETTRALSAYVKYTCKIIARNRVSEMGKRKHKIEASSATISFRTKGSGKS